VFGESDALCDLTIFRRFRSILAVNDAARADSLAAPLPSGAPRLELTGHRVKVNQSVHRPSQS
jgi:hypothetical protein